MLFFPYFFCFSAACYKIQSCYSRLHHLLSMSLFSAPLQARHPVLFVFAIFFISVSRCHLQPYPVIPAPFYLYSPAHLTAQICHSCLFFLYPFSLRPQLFPHISFSSTFSTDPSCRHTTPIFPHTPLFSLFFRDPIATVPFYSCIFFIFILRHPYNRTNLSFLPLFSLSFFPPPAAITPLCYSCIYLLFSL